MTTRVVLSVSGGKDSTAAGLWLLEQGIDFEAVHMDTGWEHPATDEYVREVLPRVLGRPVRILRSAGGGMVDWIRRKAMFPSRTRRFCTSELKVITFINFIDSDNEDDEVVNVVGIRAEESAARAKLPERESAMDLGCEVWRPLLHWTFEDVVAIHQRHGVVPNQLYFMGASRVGCWPCIFARKAEIRMIADLDPDRIDLIRALEAELEVAAAARYAARGETFESLGYRRPTWFSAPNRDAEGKRPGMPIDDVVSWARTTRGGKQMELFAMPPGMDGCMRWGMCDAHPGSSNE